MATQIEGSTLLEATWTIIPLAIFLVTFRVGRAAVLPHLQPAGQLDEHLHRGQAVDVEGGASGRPARDQCAACADGQPVQLTMISQDVFHSFSIPDFRVKREVIPGRYSTVWFEATTPGTYHLFCTQYCGTQPLRHDRRSHGADARGLREVDAGIDQRHVAGAERRAAVCQHGLQLPATRGNAAARGPNLAGVYGSKLQLTNGSEVLVNDAYLRDAILNPSQHVTAGYAPIMPTYQGQISEDGLIDLVEYIKTLKTNYRVQQTLTTSQSDQAAPPASGMVKP